MLVVCMPFPGMQKAKSCLASDRAFAADWSLGIWGTALGSRVWGFGFRVCGLGFGFRAWGCWV